MNKHRQVAVTIERAGRPDAVHDELSADEVARLILDFRGDRGATLSIQPRGRDERLLLAVDGTQAFLGLERSDGLLQFTRREAPSTTTAFTISGQEADIKNRYLVDLEVAAAVVEEWLAAGEASSVGTWERQ